ncbi:MAG: sigma-70 family RNA polymerase sigma factor [Phycisphaerales bacterium]|nr:MAG: sigma-70 family RNA polymerase sigma factor [Phycisphaerales bacterium]
MSALLQEAGPIVRRRLRIASTWQATLDLADVMQVTYMEAFLRVGQLNERTHEAFLAWLTKIAENNLRDAVRELERARRPDPRRRVHRRNPEETTITLLEALGCTTATASRHAADREARQMIEAAIARLPDTYQKVVHLCDLEDQPVQKVAEALGKSPGAVYMLRARAHDRLREILGSESRFFSGSA